MLPSSGTVHEGNLRQSKTSKFTTGCLFHSCGIEMYTQIAARFSHDMLQGVRGKFYPRRSMDMSTNYITSYWNFLLEGWLWTCGIRMQSSRFFALVAALFDGRFSVDS